MSTRYFLTITNNNDTASSFLENFIDNSRKFNAFDIIAGSRQFSNWQRSLGIIKNEDDISVIKSQFKSQNRHNIYVASTYTEGATDIPKNNALFQNMAEVNNVVVVANGYINNKEYIARKYEFPIGLSLQEFIVAYYNELSKKSLKDELIPNMIREIESNLLSFIIVDKKINSAYIYNRGDILYFMNIPAINVAISTELLLINNVYPKSNFHKLDSTVALKIDLKTMLVQNIPINTNTFLYGKDLMLDSDKGIIYTENCDMEYLASLSILSDKDVTTINDLQTLYFGYNTDIDKIIFDKIQKLRKQLKIQGKIPVHIPYNFNNIFSTESEIIDEINRKNIESTELNPEKINSNNKKKKQEKLSGIITEKDISLNESKKINFIAMSLINWALDKGVSSIYIPNTNRKNNRLISVLKSLINMQTQKPIYVYSLFDNFNTMDLIRYVIGCKNITNLDDILINSDRYSIILNLDELGKPILNFKESSEYNYEINCAFMKCGLDNPFNNRYIGKPKIDNQFINAGIVPDKVMNNAQKAAFLHKIETVMKNELSYQKKLQSI